MILWRISNFDDLKGIGGLHAAGRWHRKGHEIIYLAESVAAALLEVLVHFECAPEDVPENFKLLDVEISDLVSISVLDESVLEKNWSKEQSVTRDIGDQWLAGQSSLLLKVPSAIIPQTYNYLFNPMHPEANQARVIRVTSHPYDRRLIEYSPNA